MRIVILAIGLVGLIGVVDQLIPLKISPAHPLLFAAAPADDPAVAAFVRGRDAFNRQDFNRAITEFNGSFSLRRHPLTAYFLSLAYYKVYDFANAERWASVSLAPVPGYTLDARYAKGARDIISFAKTRLSPPLPSPQPSGGVGLSATAITASPNPPAPTEVPESGPVARRGGFPAAAADIPAARRGGIPAAVAGGRLAQAPGTIIIEAATYGGNCGAGRGNVTAHVAGACNGQQACRYVVDYKIIGDPVPGCVKDYNLSYVCVGSQTRKEVRISGEEAGFEKTVALSCP
jgi:hypothetical protein